MHYFALARQQVDIRSILIVHPEGPVLIEGQSLGVGRQVRVSTAGAGKSTPLTVTIARGSRPEVGRPFHV